MRAACLIWVMAKREGDAMCVCEREGGEGVGEEGVKREGGRRKVHMHESLENHWDTNVVDPPPEIRSASHLRTWCVWEGGRAGGRCMLGEGAAGGRGVSFVEHLITD